MDYVVEHVSNVEFSAKMVCKDCFSIHLVWYVYYDKNPKLAGKLNKSKYWNFPCFRGIAL